MSEVILIDDSRFDLTINEMVIKKSLDTKCVKFTNPIEGCDFVKLRLENTEDQILLFLDLNMPELNGWQLLDLLSSSSPDYLDKINVLILSNSDNPTDIENSKKYNVVKHYITKPLDNTKLQSALTGLKLFNHTSQLN